MDVLCTLVRYVNGIRQVRDDTFLDMDSASIQGVANPSRAMASPCLPTWSCSFQNNKSSTVQLKKWRLFHAPQTAQTRTQVPNAAQEALIRITHASILNESERPVA